MVPCFCFYKAFWNFGYSFSFLGILLCWFFFPMCSEMLVLVFSLVFSLMFFSLCDHFYLVWRYFLSYCSLTAIFSLSSLLCVSCWWNTQIFPHVLPTCITGPRRSRHGVRCPIDKFQILESERSLFQSYLCLSVAVWSTILSRSHLIGKIGMRAYAVHRSGENSLLAVQ